MANICKCCDFPARYVLTFLAFLGFVVNYSLIIDINIAMVAMIDSSAIEKVDSVQGFAACDSNLQLTSSDDDGQRKNQRAEKPQLLAQVRKLLKEITR